MSINKTKDYDLFANHPKNRVTSVSHVQDLKNKILSSNHLDANPIIVTDYSAMNDPMYVTGQLNPKYFVCQGAHRLQAAKELKLDIYYTYKAGLTPKDVQDLNSAKSWTNLDWLEFHQDKPNYRELKIFMETYKLQIGLGKTIISLAPSVKKSCFEGGELKIADLNTSKKIALALQLMSSSLPDDKKKIPYSTRFVRHLILAMKSRFDLDHLVSQVQKYPHKMLSTPNEQMAKSVIETLYNFNQRSNNSLKLA